MTNSEIIELIKKIDKHEREQSQNWDPEYVQGYSVACCDIRGILLDALKMDESN